MKKKLELTNYNIDNISEITEGFLKESGAEKQGTGHLADHTLITGLIVH